MYLPPNLLTLLALALGVVTITTLGDDHADSESSDQHLGPSYNDDNHTGMKCPIREAYDAQAHRMLPHDKVTFRVSVLTEVKKNKHTLRGCLDWAQEKVQSAKRKLGGRTGMPGKPAEHLPTGLLKTTSHTNRHLQKTSDKVVRRLPEGKIKKAMMRRMAARQDSAQQSRTNDHEQTPSSSSISGHGHALNQDEQRGRFLGLFPPSSQPRTPTPSRIRCLPRGGSLQRGRCLGLLRGRSNSSSRAYRFPSVREWPKSSAFREDSLVEVPRQSSTAATSSDHLSGRLGFRSRSSSPPAQSSTSLAPPSNETSMVLSSSLQRGSSSGRPSRAESSPSAVSSPPLHQPPPTTRTYRRRIAAAPLRSLRRRLRLMGRRSPRVRTEERGGGTDSTPRTHSPLPPSSLDYSSLSTLPRPEDDLELSLSISKSLR